jgi:hypothetical protein
MFLFALCFGEGELIPEHVWKSFARRFFLHLSLGPGV